MGGIFEAFEVYNKKKHASNPHMFGGASNTGGTKTDYVYSSEYRAPKSKKLDNNELLGTSTADTGIESNSSTAAAAAAALGGPHMVDVSKLSRRELDDLMKTLRKGEPDNRVNF
ncbi:LAME_0A04544g1_1 [Lachancea meyersii CBS 8951]|uniref:Stationary phase protein 4 n=1 Tax=Lachancea meyersii CBS 8951 TaxID=1266667 RepID=A0A1G4IP59_9SACH|nr:LAME_0A04544g1_1 [Lachancea meyersii CBS 8951]